MRVLSLTLVLVASGCQDVPSRSPCADVDCSGHGTCLARLSGAEASAPVCQCDPGYVATSSGLLCVPAQDPSLCAGVTCSGHGTCTSFEGRARCECETGYQLGPGGTTCVDPCEGVACSGHGDCTRTAAGPRCACDAGYRTGDDGLTCERSSAGRYVVYALSPDHYPGYKMGRMTLDLTDEDQGRVVEQMRFFLYFDYGGRGLGRSVRQIWELDAAGAVIAVEIDDLLAQGTVGRRRWVKASLAGGQVTTTFQRLDKQATAKIPYTGTEPPLPMLGAYEYPGWTLGCFSAAFYARALERYDPASPDPQTIEVFLPSGISVMEVPVEAGPGWTSTQPELVFPDHGMRVVYDADGLPQTIHIESQEMTWTRYEGTPSDLNLAPRPDSAAVPPPTVPGDHTDTTVTIPAPGGVDLAATLTAPSAGTGPHPAVLLVPGPLAADRDVPFARLPRAALFRHLAAHLAHAGIASLRYDPRGTGASGGDASSVTLSQLTQDAAAARAALEGRADVDATRVHIVSHGLGALIALEVLHTGAAPRSFVGLAPALTAMRQALLHRLTEPLRAAGFSDSMIDKQATYYGETADKLAAGTYEEPTYLGAPSALWKELLAADGLPTLTALGAPALLVRGEEDLEIAATQLSAARSAAAEEGNSHVTTTTLAGLTFTLTPGAKATLWESAQLPLDLAPAAVSALTTWLAAH